MSQTAPPTIPSVGAIPTSSNIATFDADADAAWGSMPAVIAGMNGAAAATYSNAQDAYANALDAASKAASAAASATAAQATANVVPWVSGSTYADGVNVYSPIDSLTYRRTANSAGPSTTDPSIDRTRWVCLSGGKTVWIRKTSAYTAISGDYIKASTAAGAWSLTFPAAPSDGDEIGVQDVDGTFQTNNLTLLANGKKINGNTTSFVLDTQYDRFVFVYDATLGDWRI